MDIEAVNDHLRELSQHNGHYDTIFLVSPAGIGVAGVERDPAAERPSCSPPARPRRFKCPTATGSGEPWPVSTSYPRC